MKVRIGAIEITDISLEELDELVRRYGPGAFEPEGEESAQGQSGTHRPQGNQPRTADQVVLKKLVDAGTQGIPTNDLGEMLGRRGKATRNAARDWAHRIGIVSDPNIDPFEETRVGTQRGIRIKASLMDIARAHLK